MSLFLTHSHTFPTDTSLVPNATLEPEPLFKEQTSQRKTTFSEHMFDRSCIEGARKKLSNLEQREQHSKYLLISILKRLTAVLVKTASFLNTILSMFASNASEVTVNAMRVL